MQFEYFLNDSVEIFIRQVLGKPIEEAEYLLVAMNAEY
jgi:hypothetical protein